MKVTEKVIAMVVQFVTVLTSIVAGIMAFLQEISWVLLPIVFILTINAYMLVHTGIPLWEWIQDQGDVDDD